MTLGFSGRGHCCGMFSSNLRSPSPLRMLSLLRCHIHLNMTATIMMESKIRTKIVISINWRGKPNWLLPFFQGCFQKKSEQPRETGSRNAQTGNDRNAAAANERNGSTVRRHNFNHWDLIEIDNTISSICNSRTYPPVFPAR